MATKLGLYNGALRRIKQARLETISDDVEARYLLDDCYAGIVGFCLEAGLWNFAQRSVEITPDDDLTPSWGYNNSFVKPDDYIRLVAISDNEMMDPPLDNYLDENSGWHANVDPLYVTYISRDVSLGGFNLALWPESFARAVEHRLALEVAPHLTAMGTDAMRLLGKDFDRLMRNARTMDAVNQPIQRSPVGRLVRARMGGSRLSQRRATR